MLLIAFASLCLFVCLLHKSIIVRAEILAWNGTAVLPSLLPGCYQLCRSSLLGVRWMPQGERQTQRWRRENVACQEQVYDSRC